MRDTDFSISSVVNKVTQTLRFGALVILATLVGCGEQDALLPDPNDPQGDLKVLPADRGGSHTAVVLSNSNIYGHYLYLPEGYDKNGPEYPMIVFLHGGGEKGNSMDSAAHLSRVLLHGPPRHIEANQWDPPFPAVVVSPQCHDAEWDAAKLHDFVGRIADEHAINKRRIYFTGLSMGAFGVFEYVSVYGASSLAAAIVPIAGWGNPATASSFVETPVWAFHNLDDTRISANSSIRMIEAINENNPIEKARVTIFSASGHNAWTKPYAGRGMGTESADYDAYDETIYEWFFEHAKKSTIQ